MFTHGLSSKLDRTDLWSVYFRSGLFLPLPAPVSGHFIRCHNIIIINVHSTTQLRSVGHKIVETSRTLLAPVHVGPMVALGRQG